MFNPSSAASVATHPLRCCSLWIPASAKTNRILRLAWVSLTIQRLTTTLFGSGHNLRSTLVHSPLRVESSAIAPLTFDSMGVTGDYYGLLDMCLQGNRLSRETVSISRLLTRNSLLLHALTRIPCGLWGSVHLRRGPQPVHSAISAITSRIPKLLRRLRLSACYVRVVSGIL